MKTELVMCRTIAIVALGLFCATGMSAEPANPKSNPAARALLDYFHDLSGRTEGKRILSGQFSDFGNAANLRITERVHEKTGRWPALIGVDYADFPRGSLTTKIPNQVAINYWKQGGLVTVMAHMYNPANPKGGGLRDKGVINCDCTVYQCGWITAEHCLCSLTSNRLRNSSRSVVFNQPDDAERIRYRYFTFTWRSLQVV